MGWLLNCCGKHWKRNSKGKCKRFLEKAKKEICWSCSWSPINLESMDFQKYWVRRPSNDWKKWSSWRITASKSKFCKIAPFYDKDDNKPSGEETKSLSKSSTVGSVRHKNEWNGIWIFIEDGSSVCSLISFR